VKFFGSRSHALLVSWERAFFVGLTPFRSEVVLSVGSRERRTLFGRFRNFGLPGRIGEGRLFA